MAKQSAEILASIPLEYQLASLQSQCIIKMKQRNLFLKKQSGRVIENKGKWPKTNRKQSGNKATEVVENTGSA